MKIVCDQCGAKYSIDDTKVQNKSFKITCKKCGNKIVIQKKEEDTDEIANAAAANWADEMGSDEGYDEGATRVFNYAEMNKVFENAESTHDVVEEASIAHPVESPVETASIAEPIDEPAEPVVESTEWYLHINGNQAGPFSQEEAQQTVQKESLSGDANAWCTGMADWKMLKEIPEMKDYVKAPAVTAPTNPFGNSGDQSAAFGNSGLLNDSETESLFNDKSSAPAAGGFAAATAASTPTTDAPFGNVSSSFGSNSGGGVDLRSLINDEDLDEDEDEDASSKSKVIDFREIAGKNAQKVVVQHASFNVGSGGDDSKKGLIIGIVAFLLIIGGGAAAFFMFQGEKTHKFTVITTPKDAEVYINDVLKGATPLNNIELASGGYKIRIEKKGFQKFSRSIRIEGDLSRKFDLKRKVYTVKISTKPAGANIYLDDELVGKSPTEVKMKHGKRSIRLSLAGYQELTVRPSITEDGAKEYPLQQATAIAMANTTGNQGGTTVENPVKTPQKTGTTKKTVRTKKHTTKKPRKIKKVSLVGKLPKTLNRDQVKKVINRTHRKLKVCVRNAGLSGTIGGMFTIQRSGRVSGVRVANNAGGAKACMLGHLKRMRFPAFSGKPIPVKYPFKF